MPPRTSLTLGLVFILIISGLTTTPSAASGPEPAAATTLEGAFVLNEVLIGLQPDAAIAARTSLEAGQAALASLGRASLDHLIRQYAVQTVTPLFESLDAADAAAAQTGLSGVFKLTTLPGVDIFTLIAELRQDPSVVYAEPNRIYRASELPNDPDFAKQWGLHNTRQTGGRADADIDAPAAWDITKGSPTVLIAVVDTGVDYNHPDLRGGRVRTDIDRDFVNNDEDAWDDHGHGTFVAGIAAADTQNGVGMAGVCRGCRVLPVKVLNKDGSGTAEWVAKGIQYAAQSKAQVISMSLGFPSNCGCSQTVARAVNYAFESGSLLVAASGNDSDKNQTSYPASSPRVMAVGASDHNDQEASFSNRDSYLDIVAPGKDIYSLKPNGGYDTASGTSAATPFVSGVAGLIWSLRPGLTNTQVWWRLYQSADDFPAPKNSALAAEAPAILPSIDPASLKYRIFLPSVSRLRSTSGRLNAEEAVKTTVSGQVFAPADTCSGEPSNCAPGCGAEVSSAGSNSALQNLRSLRQFRDDSLLTVPAGRHWVEVYNRHRLELATLLANEAPLREQARAGLELWLPLIQTLAEPETSGPQVIRPEHIQHARAMLIDLRTQSSPELAHDLEAAAAVIDLADTYVNRDVREFWQALAASAP